MKYLPDVIGHGAQGGMFEHLHIFLSGSSVICDPPVLNTDRDYFMLVDNLDGAGTAFYQRGWRNCFEDWLSKSDTDPAKLSDDGYSVEIEGGSRFQAWRMLDENVIVTDDEALHLRNVGATYVAKALNLQRKEDRISLFRCMKYGEALSNTALRELRMVDAP